MAVMPGDGSGPKVATAAVGFSDGAPERTEENITTREQAAIIDVVCQHGWDAPGTAGETPALRALGLGLVQGIDG